MNKLNNEIRITGDLSLVPVNPADQTQLLKLMDIIYPQTYAHLWQDQGRYYVQATFAEENLAKELKQPGTLYCFISYRSDICGILRVIENAPCIDFKDIPAAKLHRIYLDKKYQGKGIGKEIMLWIEKRVKNNNLVLIWLEVMDTQTAALGFYSKRGFQISGHFELQYKFLNSTFKGMYRMYKYVNL